MAFKTWLKLNVSLALVVAYSKIYLEWNSPGLIGNAVPVQIGEVLAQSLLAHVQKYNKPLK